MELPVGVWVERDHPIEEIVRLDNNIYGLKDKGLFWFETFKEVMEARRFVQYQVNTCVSYRD